MFAGFVVHSIEIAFRIAVEHQATPGRKHTAGGRITLGFLPSELASCRVISLGVTRTRVEVDNLRAEVPFATLPLHFLGLEVHGKIVHRYVNHLAAMAVSHRVPLFTTVKRRSDVGGYLVVHNILLRIVIDGLAVVGWSNWLGPV